jgi:hypothetical protein
MVIGTPAAVDVLGSLEQSLRVMESAPLQPLEWLRCWCSMLLWFCNLSSYRFTYNAESLLQHKLKNRFKIVALN